MENALGNFVLIFSLLIVLAGCGKVEVDSDKKTQGTKTGPKTQGTVDCKSTEKILADAVTSNPRIFHVKLKDRCPGSSSELRDEEQDVATDETTGICRAPDSGSVAATFPVTQDNKGIKVVCRGEKNGKGCSWKAVEYITGTSANRAVLKGSTPCKTDQWKVYENFTQKTISGIVIEAEQTCGDKQGGKYGSVIRHVDSAGNTKDKVEIPPKGNGVGKDTLTVKPGGSLQIICRGKPSGSGCKWSVNLPTSP